MIFPIIQNHMNNKNHTNHMNYVIQILMEVVSYHLNYKLCYHKTNHKLFGSWVFLFCMIFLGIAKLIKRSVLVTDKQREYFAAKDKEG